VLMLYRGLVNSGVARFGNACPAIRSGEVLRRNR
jgi:hypothetical protein